MEISGTIPQEVALHVRLVLESLIQRSTKMVILWTGLESIKAIQGLSPFGEPDGETVSRT